MKKLYGIQLPILLLSLSVGFISFVLPIYAKEMNMNALKIGGLFSIVSLVNIVIRPIVGKGLDRYGRKIFLVIACILIGFALIGYAYSIHEMILYGARALHALGSAVLSLTIYSISIDLSSEDNVGNRIGLLDAAKSKGGLVGAIIGFLIFLNNPFLNGWKTVFIFYSGCCFFAFFYVLIKTPETKKMNQEMVKTKLKINRFLFIMLTIILLTSLTSSMVTPIFMIFLQDHISNKVSYLAMSFIPASIIFSIFPPKAGRIIDYYGRKKTLMIGKIIGVISILLFIQVNNIISLIILWMFQSIGIILSTISYKTLISDYFGKHHIGQMYGIFMVMVSIGGIIGPLFGGFLYEIQYSLPFYINAFIKIMNLFIILCFIPKTVKM